jgi:uncharacterized protein YdcH (DUF465 family)
MAQLSFEIQALLNQVKLLKQKNPNNQDLIDKYNQLEELLEKAQDKEWNDNFQGYVDAKNALNSAKTEVQAQLTKISNIAVVIENIASAVDKVTAILEKVA